MALILVMIAALLQVIALAIAVPVGLRLVTPPRSRSDRSRLRTPVLPTDPSPSAAEFEALSFEELWAVSYLRRATQGVTEFMLCAAFASGWLGDAGDGENLVLHTLEEECPVDPRMAEFYRALVRLEKRLLTRHVVMDAAVAISQAMEPALRATVETAGLARPPLRGWLAAGGILVLSCSSGSWLVFAAAMLFAGGPRSAQPPDVVVVAFMVLASAVMVVVPYAVLWREWLAYCFVGWAVSCTRSLGDGVRVGSRTLLKDVALVVASAGPASVQGAPFLTEHLYEFVASVAQDPRVRSTRGFLTLHYPSQWSQ